MGSVCCVAAREGTLQNESSSEILRRNVRYSPSWNFRWDNRGRVAGEETSVSWYLDGVSRNDGLENKSETVVETAHASEVGSPAENFQSLAWAKSPLSEGSAVKRRTPVSDPSISRSISMEVTGASEFPAESDRSPVKLSPVMSSTPSLSTSPLSSQSHLFPASLTPSRLAHRSPRNPLLRLASDSRIPVFKSPSNYSISEERPSPTLPPWSNESTRVSHGGSSDGWSMHGFPEFMATSYRERWSFDSESLGFNRDKITRSSSRISASPSIDLQTCGVCSKLLSEKSSFSSQKIVVTNDHAVVSVLICGHVYHAECLENMTPEITKYDPACPVCTLGEQQVLKMSEKVLKAEMDSKARKRLRKRVADGDFDVFDHRKGSGHEGKGPKMASSSSMKSSFAKPFLKRHFSFGSKSSKSFTESNSTRKNIYMKKSIYLKEYLYGGEFGAAGACSSKRSFLVTGATEFPAESDRSPVKLSPVMSSTPSLSTSPLSSQSHLFPASLTPSRLAHHSPRNPLLRHASDSRIPVFKSPSKYSILEERPSPTLPPWSNESTRVSHGGSSDGWSMHGFPEFMATSYRERWSFDSESLGFNRDKITRSSSRISASPSIDLQTCGVCSKLLSEKSSFSSQKIVVTNDHAVVSVLICGHVYHAECLENMTPEITKYDPACPVCTLGEQQVLKMSEKVLKAEMDSKARKRLRKRVADGDFDVFDHRKGSGHEGKGPKMASSSSMKSSFAKPFLKRHFSFGSKSSKSFTESNSTRKNIYMKK